MELRELTSVGYIASEHGGSVSVILNNKHRKADLISINAKGDDVTSLCILARKMQCNAILHAKNVFFV